jgi:hypothetical protein
MKSLSPMIARCHLGARFLFAAGAADDNQRPSDLYRRRPGLAFGTGPAEEKAMLDSNVHMTTLATPL